MMGVVPWKVKSIPLIVLLQKKIQKEQNWLHLYPIIVLYALAAVGSTGTTLGALWA